MKQSESRNDNKENGLIHHVKTNGMGSSGFGLLKTQTSDHRKTEFRLRSNSKEILLLRWKQTGRLEEYNPVGSLGRF